MARLIGGLGISHTPSMGYEYDRVRASGGEPTPAWKRWFEGVVAVREAVARLAPEHLVVVYNDHLNYFDLDNLPTLAVGIADRFPQADEGWGRRDVPDLAGDASWGRHVFVQLVEQEFDPNLCLALEPDHGIYSWFPYVFDPATPVTVTPIAVNLVCHPIPKASRMIALGRALRSAIACYPSRERVMIVGTGGMSHQINGTRFGIANEGLNQAFLDALPTRLEQLAAIPVAELMRLGGTEAAELILWYAMRAALDEAARAVASFHTFPSITGCGALVMSEPDGS